MKTWSKRLALSTLFAAGSIATWVACNSGNKLPEIPATQENYRIFDIPISEVPTFVQNDTTAATDSLDHLIRIQGTPHGKVYKGGLKFFIENTSNERAYCKLMDNSKIATLAGALFDMNEILRIPRDVTVTGSIDEGNIDVMRLNYNNIILDENMDLSNLFEGMEVRPKAREYSLAQLKKMAVKGDTLIGNIAVKGNIFGFMEGNGLAFVLGDGMGNDVLVYRKQPNSQSSRERDAFSRGLAIIDMLNQRPTVARVIGDYSGSFGGILNLNSISDSRRIKSAQHEISFDKDYDTANFKNAYLTAEEARILDNYPEIKMVGSIKGVNYNDNGIKAFLEDFENNTIILERNSTGDMADNVALMLDYANAHEMERRVIDGRTYFRYVEVIGELRRKKLKIEQVRDVWSPKPIENRIDMPNTIHREGVDHFYDFNN